MQDSSNDFGNSAGVLCLPISCLWNLTTTIPADMAKAGIFKNRIRNPDFYEKTDIKSENLK